MAANYGLSAAFPNTSSVWGLTAAQCELLATHTLESRKALDDKPKVVPRARILEIVEQANQKIAQSADGKGKTP